MRGYTIWVPILALLECADSHKVVFTFLGYRQFRIIAATSRQLLLSLIRANYFASLRLRLHDVVAHLGVGRRLNLTLHRLQRLAALLVVMLVDGNLLRATSLLCIVVDSHHLLQPLSRIHLHCLLL